MVDTDIVYGSSWKQTIDHDVGNVVIAKRLGILFLIARAEQQDACELAVQDHAIFRAAAQIGTEGSHHGDVIRLASDVRDRLQAFADEIGVQAPMLRGFGHQHPDDAIGSLRR